MKNDGTCWLNGMNKQSLDQWTEILLNGRARVRNHSIYYVRLDIPRHSWVYATICDAFWLFTRCFKPTTNNSHSWCSCLFKSLSSVHIKNGRNGPIIATKRALNWHEILPRPSCSWDSQFGSWRRDWFFERENMMNSCFSGRSTMIPGIWSLHWPCTSTVATRCHQPPSEDMIAAKTPFHPRCLEVGSHNLLPWRLCQDKTVSCFMRRNEFVSFVEGSLEVKLPTIWTDEKQSRAEAERRERLEERRSEKTKSQKKEDADARKGRKVAKHCVFPMIWGSGGSKSRLAKAAGAEPAGQMRDEKVHAVVARSTFASQNVQSTPGPDLFWQLRCRKSARRCGAKHISKSKCTKHTRSGPLLGVDLSKKCTPLWREAHFEVKMYKTHHSRTTFGSCDVEKVHAAVARSTFPSQNVQNTTCSRHFWRFGCWKSARRCGAKHVSK